MSNYLHTKIRDIADDGLREVFAELCHCARWDLARHEGGTVFHLLSSIFLECAESLSLDFLPSPCSLEMKVRKLPAGAVLDFCRELIALKRTSIDEFDRKPLLTLIKTCFPRLGQPDSTGDGLSHFDRETRLIMQRRRNRGG